ncbi:MAG: hypothetical protein ABUK01_12310 [Leptospirales bacterium]
MSYSDRSKKSSQTPGKKRSSSKTHTDSSHSRPGIAQMGNNARDCVMYLQRTVGNRSVGVLAKASLFLEMELFNI